MKINNFFVKTFMITLFSIGNSAYSLSLEDAETKANEVCAACHGKDGITAVLPSYPILAGQHEDYLNQALLDYKLGQEKTLLWLELLQLCQKTILKVYQNILLHFLDL